MRTAWNKSATRWSEGANQILVTMYHCYQNSSHFVITLLKSLFKPSFFEALSIWSFFLTITTKSIPKSFILCIRKSWRISRLAAFLSTALGKSLFATMIPSLEIAKLFGIKNTLKQLSETCLAVKQLL